jgi:predicted O-methyltransferase YrrM
MRQTSCLPCEPLLHQAPCDRVHVLDVFFKEPANPQVWLYNICLGLSFGPVSAVRLLNRMRTAGMLSEPDSRTLPAVWHDIRARSVALGFDMASDGSTGALLKALAASKPHGRLLELGTGTGLATACLLAGMDKSSQLVSVDIDARCQMVAQELLGSDPRVSFKLADGLQFIQSQPQQSFDLVFADAWPGKYEGLDVALALVRRGGFFVGDDMLPQPSWPANQQERVDSLIAHLERLEGWTTVTLCWGSGFVVAVRL